MKRSLRVVLACCALLATCRRPAVEAPRDTPSDGPATSSAAPSRPSPAAPITAAAAERSDVEDDAAVDDDSSSPAIARPAEANTASPPVARPVGAGADPACHVAIERVIAAEVFRGSGYLPPTDLDPATAREWMAEDHAEQHVRCTYLVRINGAAFVHEEVAAQGFATVGPGLDPGLCSRPAHQDEVVRHLRIVTDCGSTDGLRRSDIRLRPAP